MQSRLFPVFCIFASVLLMTMGAWFFVSRPSDEQVVALALRNIGKLETFEYRGALSLAADRSREHALPLFDGVFYNRGVLASNRESRPNLTNAFEARLYFPEGRYRFRGDFIRADSATYLKLAELPSFGLLNLADVAGRWFVVPALWDTGPVSREVRSVASIIGDGGMFHSVTRLADDRIEGRAVYHVQATLNPGAFTEFARTAVLGQGGGVTEAEHAAAFVRERMAIDTIDLWVTKRGFDVYRARAVGSVRLERFAPTNIIASVDLRRHNHSFTLRPPVVDAPSVETVLAPIGANIGMAGFETGTLTSALPPMPPLGARDLPLGNLAAFSADTDRDGLTNLMEQVHGSDPLNPDSDADGYSDGSEVERRYDPMGPGTLR